MVIFVWKLDNNLSIIINLAMPMKNLLAIFIALLFLSCDNDVYETYNKQGEFTINRIKRSGKRHLRGFYVDGFEKKIKYRDIRNGKYKVGDKVILNYDSTINKTKGTYDLKLQRRLEGEE
jgi:hypothetical protein